MQNLPTRPIVAAAHYKPMHATVYAQRSPAWFLVERYTAPRPIRLWVMSRLKES
jgi:hypothetical protein